MAMAIPFIGIPWALQAFKIGLLRLWPFGTGMKYTKRPTGCIRFR